MRSTDEQLSLSLTVSQQVRGTKRRDQPEASALAALQRIWGRPGSEAVAERIALGTRHVLGFFDQFGLMSLTAQPPRSDRAAGRTAWPCSQGPPFDAPAQAVGSIRAYVLRRNGNGVDESTVAAVRALKSTE